MSAINVFNDVLYIIFFGCIIGYSKYTRNLRERCSAILHAINFITISHFMFFFKSTFKVRYKMYLINGHFLQPRPPQNS